MTSHAPKLSIAVQSNKPHLSAGQKKFNSLLKKIDTQRQLVESWQQTFTLYQPRWHADFKPLLEELHGADFEMLCFLSDASERVKLGKKDRATLTEIIFATIESLMGGEYDDAVKAIYKKHAGTDFDTDQAETREQFKQSLEEEFGFTLDDDIDLDSMEDVAAHISEKQREEAERLTSEQPRKKTKQQIRQEEEQANASKSLRDIYRKLASALHPDRETDTVERERKTVLMQRVNQAYADNNLLGLLQLQLEIEQIDHSHINAIAEDQLKHYNRVLADQLKELTFEASRLGAAFKAQFHFEPFDKVTPANVARKYPKVVRELREEIEELTVQLKALKDPKFLKIWLKEQSQLLDMADFLAAEMADDLFR